MKDLTESPSMSAFRVKFEAGRSFELDDDLEFCPHLLDDEDVCCNHSIRLDFSSKSDSIEQYTDDSQLQSISSTSSDGSLSSGSPQSSPLPQQMQPSQQVTPTFSLSSVTNSSYHPSTGFQSTANQNNNNNNNYNNQMKIHQPAALRTRNAIPIVNPSTGMRVASPPNSISPGNMMQQTYQRRW